MRVKDSNNYNVSRMCGHVCCVVLQKAPDHKTYFVKMHGTYPALLRGAEELLLRMPIKVSLAIIGCSVGTQQRSNARAIRHAHKHSLSARRYL